MLGLLAALATTIALLAMGQIAATLVYVRRITRYVPTELPDKQLPGTLVVMTVRGGDESLVDCLNRLADQDYPRWQLTIVVDHPSDPARAVLDRWLATRPPICVTVQFLDRPSPNATLKCSAIRQVVRNLDPSVQAIVLIDTDVQPYRHWLRDMVAPLAQPGIGAVTGNRWYFPRHGSWGSWCRFVYNGLTLPPMAWFNLAWAGSLAMRGEVARSDVFHRELARSSSDEAAVCKTLEDRHLQLHFNPRAILWNPESTSLGGCHQFLFRQLLWTRLYHPAWTPIFAHALGSYLLLATGFVSGAACLESASLGRPAAAVLGAIGLYLASVVVSLGWLHRAVRLAILPRQGNAAMPPIAVTTSLRIAAAATLTLAVYTLAILRARFANRVMWRGIEYRIQPPRGIHLVQYSPFSSPAASSSVPRPLGFASGPACRTPWATVTDPVPPRRKLP